MTDVVMKRKAHLMSGCGPLALTEDRVSEVCDSVTQRVRELFKDVKDQAHDLTHVLRVTEHVQQASSSASLDDGQRLAVVLGALLHEADDYKLFKTKDDENARQILSAVLNSEETSQLADLVIEIINLVGCAKNKNGDVDVESRWKLLVRDADRIEAMGEVGIARCFAYNQKTGAPFFVNTTPRPSSAEEVWRFATPERFAAYNGDSKSMIDHYYDKLLHLNKSASGNVYLQELMDAQVQVMVDFVLSFGRTGEIDVAAMEDLKAKWCGE